MYQNRDRGRHEQRHEDYRGSPYGHPHDYPRDISPRRYAYDRASDPRGNPHSEVYDPKFDTASPLPPYHNFPQPQYQRYYEGDCGQQGRGHPQRHFEAEGYQEKKFDWRMDNRYHKTTQEQGPRYYEEHRGDHHDHSPRREQYDVAHLHQYFSKAVKPAGRANVYNTRITDLLTSIKDPDFKDQSLSKLAEVHKGYLVMVRFSPNDLREVIPAVQETASTLRSHEGYCIGFSEPGLMHVLRPSYQSLPGDIWWGFHEGARKSNYALACFWFKDYKNGRDWFQTGHTRFKQPEFPNSRPYQAVAVPLTYGRSRDPIPFTPDRDEVTLVWSEYPHIFERYQDDFLVNYSRPEAGFMRLYGGNPHVSTCKYVPGDVPQLNKFGSPGYARFEENIDRVARSWRNCWMSQNTCINVSTFPSMENVHQLYMDPEYSKIRSELSRYADPVVVAITLKRVQGTSAR